MNDKKVTNDVYVEYNCGVDMLGFPIIVRHYFKKIKT